MNKTTTIFEQFKAAQQRLQEGLALSKSDIVRDACIKRFEFTFDLSWKLLKAVLEERHGIDLASPKTCFREAYRQGIISYDDAWIDMTDKRNSTSHTYNQATAEEIYDLLPKYVQLFQELLKVVNT